MMLELARTQGDGYVSLTEVAESQGISKKYLEQIIPFLSRASFLVTTRGFKGGYRLARDPSEYSVGEILRTTEGSLAPVMCVEGSVECENCDKCMTYPMWKKLAQLVNEYLDSISLADLLDGGVDETLDGVGAGARFLPTCETAPVRPTKNVSGRPLKRNRD